MNSRRNVHLKGTVTLVFFEPLGAPVPKCWHAILKGVKRPTRVDFRFRGQGFTFRSNKKTAKNRHLIHVEDPDSSSHFGCPSFPQLFNMYIYILHVYIYIYRMISNTWFLWFWWWSHDGGRKPVKSVEVSNPRLESCRWCFVGRKDFLI